MQSNPRNIQGEKGGRSLKIEKFEGSLEDMQVIVVCGGALVRVNELAPEMRYK